MKSFSKYLSLLATVVALVLTSVTTEADRRERDTLFVFGDSLSDTGNLLIATQALPVPIPPSKPPHRTFSDGRFSNGPVAVEYLWALIKKDRANPDATLKPILAINKLHQKGAVNFAFGGARSGVEAPPPGQPLGPMVPGLQKQTGFFAAALEGRSAPADALYVIFIGANDYLALTPLPPPAAPCDPSLANFPVVCNIVNAVLTLYGLGAREMMVVNLPDLGRVPFAQPIGVAPQLTALSMAHNQALSTALTGLESRLSALEIIPVNAFQFLDGYLAPPSQPILSPAVDALVPTTPPAPPTSACLFIDAATCPNVRTFNVSPLFVFWDAQHPTTATHAAFGQFMYDTLLQQ